MAKEISSSYIPISPNKSKAFYRLALTIKPNADTVHLILTDMVLPFVTYSFFSDSNAKLVRCSITGRTIKIVLRNRSEEHVDVSIYMKIYDMTKVGRIKHLSSDSRKDSIPIDDSVPAGDLKQQAESKPTEY